MDRNAVAYTFDMAEAALCLWEACLDAPKGSTLETLFETARDERGTSDLRAQMLTTFAPACEALYTEILADAPSLMDCLPYDWEFCPAFLARAWDWDNWKPLVDARSIMAEALRERAA